MPMVLKVSLRLLYLFLLKSRKETKITKNFYTFSPTAEKMTKEGEEASNSHLKKNKPLSMKTNLKENSTLSFELITIILNYNYV